jgi:hypothetical protein
MGVPVRIRRLAARHPWVRWSVVIALATAAAGLVLRAGDRVEQARDSWGRTRDVLVAVEPIAPGDVVHDAVEVRRLPEPLVAATALGNVDPGVVARQHVGVGEIVGAADVAPGVGRTALLDEGQAAVAVGEVTPSGARPGERVQVVATGTVIASRGRVLAADGGVVLVAVDVADAAIVAAAALDGTAAIVVLP